MRLLSFYLILMLYSNQVFSKELNLVIKDIKGKLVENAVVFLEGLPKKTKQEKTKRREVVQINRAFVPKVLIVQKGEKVFFPNKDKTKHNVYSISDKKKFSLGLYGRGKAPSVKFNKVGPVVIGCNIHDWMSGFVYVVDSSYFGTTRDGQIKLNIPTGEKFKVGIWHPRIRRNKTKYFKVSPENLKSSMELKISLKK